MDVVALGELLIDFTHISSDEAGYPTMAAHPGGAPANFLAPLAKFGMDCALLGKVGNDAFGRILTDTIKNAGINTAGLRMDPSVFTTLAFVTLSPEGERDFSFARKPGADTCLTPDEVDFSLIEKAKVFHFGTLSLTHDPSLSATKKAVAFAKEKGKIISFDPNLRPPLWADLEKAKEAMLWGLSQADVVKISGEEADFLFHLPPEEAGLFICKNFGVSLIFVTLGAEGCFYTNGKIRGRVPSLSGITPRDTTGAGDIFGGSAMYALLKTEKELSFLNEEDLSRIIRFATAVAGLSTQKAGGFFSVPEMGEVKAVLSR